MNLNFSKRIGALLVLGVVLAAAGCGGDSSSTTTLPGIFTGTVKKGTSPVAGVVVTPSPATGPAAVTDLDGVYRLAVTPGSYTLSFAGDNLEPATASATVGAGETVTVDQTMAASVLVVTVTLPPELRFGGPAGFDRTVEGITASATLDGDTVSSPDVTWSIKEYYGLGDPPAPATPNPATGTTTSFAIADFETIREGANAWMNGRYATTDTDAAFEYIQAPPRYGLLSFGTQQVRAMSYLVKATVRAGGRTATGSQVVSPVTISSGGNTQPLGMMVVANAPPPAEGEAASYAWTLQYVDTNSGTEFGDPIEGVTLQGATTKNPYVVPTVAGVYKLADGTNEILFRVSTYHGAGAADTERGADGVACVLCHNGDHGDHWLTSKFEEWNGSAHANFFWKDPFTAPTSLFEFGVTGGEGTGYKESCISCHVVGYSKIATADNKGWDDEARTRTVPGTTPPQADPYVFPSPPAPAAWDDVTKYSTETSNSALLHRANIQCESCHGPLEPSGHGSVAVVGYGAVAPAASMDAGICLVCHDALTHHDRGSLWAASGHANVELAMEDATVETRPTSFSATSNSVSGVGHCGRCHAAEGFALYLDQQQGRGCAEPTAMTPALTADANNATGRAGYIRPRDTAGTCFAVTSDVATQTAADTYFRSVGLTQAKVHSQTCQVCHDPHSTELRLSGDTNVTAASFNYKNAGAGALCIVCHNSRIGAPVYSDSAKSSYSAPHAASQGDVFAGRNAYFYGQATAGAAMDVLNFKTKHSFMANACADCHVKWVPEDVKDQYQVWNTNHTFKTSMKVCAECHAEGIGERVAEQVEEKMASLSTKLGVLYKDKLNAGGADSMSRYVIEDNAIGEDKLADAAIAVDSVQGIALSEFHGQPALIVTLTDGTKFGNNIGSFKLATVALFPGTAAGGIPAKAFFNYLLLHGGAAEGVHNPFFVNGVLDATIAQVNTVPAL
jgi:cytochrome c1